MPDASWAAPSQAVRLTRPVRDKVECVPTRYADSNACVPRSNTESIPLPIDNRPSWKRPPSGKARASCLHEAKYHNFSIARTERQRTSQHSSFMIDSAIPRASRLCRTFRDVETCRAYPRCNSAPSRIVSPPAHTSPCTPPRFTHKLCSSGWSPYSRGALAQRTRRPMA